MLFGSKSCIGLDIGSSYLNAVQLNDTKGGYELELFDIQLLPPELIVDGSIIDSLRLVESLKEFIKKAGIKTKNAVISISGHSSVIIKRISLPEMTEEELSESIKFEAEQYVPFDIEDVNLDFQIIGPKEEPGQMDVILVAVKKDTINEYVSAVKEAGLETVIVDVDAFALSNTYELSYEIEPNRSIALVNIGASTINLVIIKDGIPVFTRDSAIGSKLHTEALQRDFNLSYENAERLKRGEPIENVSPEDVVNVMAGASEEIISEISRSFDYFGSTTLDEDIVEVILSGGGALIKGFSELFIERFNMEVKIVEPFSSIIIPKKFDETYIKELSPIMAVAVGLALRRIDDR